MRISDWSSDVCSSDLNVLYRLVVAQHLQQRGIEAAGGVPVGRRLELVLETEGVEEAAQARIVVVPEALVLAEGIGNAGQRLAEVLGHHLLVGDVVGHLAQAVISSEKQNSRVGTSDRRWNAWRTM